jgi:hypothetical protein
LRGKTKKSMRHASATPRSRRAGCCIPTDAADELAPQAIRMIEDFGSKMQEVFGCHAKTGPFSVAGEDDQPLRQRKEAGLG